MPDHKAQLDDDLFGLPEAGPDSVTVGAAEVPPKAGTDATPGRPLKAASVGPSLANADVSPAAAQIDLSPAALDLGSVLIPLLKSVLYRVDDPALWAVLIELQSRVRDFVAVLNLDLLLDESEGYAFLKARPEPEDESATPPPRLVARRPLSFQLSLLLALLRKKLVEFDASGADTRLVLSLDAVVELVRVFSPANANEARLMDQVQAQLNKLVELGFVRKLKSSGSRVTTPDYEVQRILKAFVDAQWLADLDARLAAYQGHLAQTGVQDD